MTEVWRRLRSTDPVHRHPATPQGPEFWVVSRYEDVVRVLRDDGDFTSEDGNVLTTMLLGGDTGARRMLAVTDGPHHTELRKLLLKAFAPRALADVAVRVRRLIRRLLEESVERGGCDFARDVASVIPLETICDLLDVPVADRPEVLRLTKSALASDYETPGADVDRIARGEILLYFSDLVTERRKRPGTDPISLMATAEVGGRRLDDEDIILNCYSLIMGGDETSRLSMIGAVEAFAAHPGQWAALRNGDVTVESAGEEILRWTTPTMHFGRTARADVRLGDRSIAAGDLVTLWFTSANRDETVFPDPDRFDLGRSPNKHLSLGYGRHFCLGAYLGRVEINAMLDGLRTFVQDIEQAGPGRRIFSNFLSGMSSLPVRLKGDPAGPSNWKE
ncbi:cytochrome P450 [Actinomadura sp. DC4]|uniref:cytochrome P450 n=1 Tax=Actinomadura sp. DC4 TaxID=3055069 RepID=UPI0025B02B7E|nr:cytochrome P450 [Actinomadura sp. DC4]MDN3356466.1 cytochrome P450 [Actinomadura sp. DC4]